MKKIILVFFFLFCSIIGHAAPINYTDIISISNNKLKQLSAINYSVSKTENISISNQESFYLVHLAPQGYMIITNNESLPVILSYSLDCNITNENPFINFIKCDIKNRIKNSEFADTKIIENYKSEREKILLEKFHSQIDNDYMQFPPQGTTSTGGWLESKWTQTAPYNNMIPLDPVSGGRSLAGCPAIAMGQILNYIKTTNGVKFTDADDYYHNYAGRNYWIDDDSKTIGFPSFPSLNLYLDSLQYHYDNNLTVTNTDKAALIFACAVAAKQVFTSSASGTFAVDQAFAAYQKFNFTNSRLLTSERDNVYENMAINIIDSLVCHLATVTPSNDAGHNFNVDGYNTDGYFHLNMGWGGTYNGWYLLPIEIPYNLTVLEGVIINITDKSYENVNGTIQNAKLIEPNYNCDLDLIRKEGEKKWLKFQIEAGTEITINTKRIGDFNFTPFLWLYKSNDASGSDIAESNYIAYSDSVEQDVRILKYYADEKAYYFLKIADSTNIDGADTYSNIGAFKFSIDTTLVTTMDESGISVIKDFTLFNNYPNPFNPSTEISYSIPSSGLVTINIFNSLGQKVVELINQFQSAGKHHITWNGKSENNTTLSAGIYFCNIRYNNTSKTIKMTLLK